MRRVVMCSVLGLAMCWVIKPAMASSALSLQEMASVHGGSTNRCKSTTCPPSINPCACVHRPSDPPGFYYCDQANPSIACDDRRIQPKTGEGNFYQCDSFGVGPLCPDDLTWVECGEILSCECDWEGLYASHACEWLKTIQKHYAFLCP
ncbi:MAG: hypothetical protein Q7T82_17335 [Armatimonadota bacterium]|nr:hypothetical protein [Armatimonadota bacterium]